MMALIRYVMALFLARGRWAAPLLGIMLTTALVWVPPLTLDSAALTLLTLFPLSAWLGYAAGTIESAGQEQMTASHAGSVARVWIAKCITAVALAVLLPCASVLAASTVAGWQPLSTAYALAAVLLTACAGAALGTLLALPLRSAPGWALCATLLATFVEILTPHMPPVRGFIKLLAKTDFGVADALWPVVGSLALTGVLLVARALIGRRLG